MSPTLQVASLLSGPPGKPQSSIQSKTSELEIWAQILVTPLSMLYLHFLTFHLQVYL